MVNAIYLDILDQITKTWISSLAVEFKEDKIQISKTHPLLAEITAFNKGQSASLPYFKENKVAWFTVAPDVNNLIATIANLRAWIIPSYGWEDDERPLALPSDNSTPLSNSLFTVSPSGYFRWWTHTSDVLHVIKKLQQIRALEVSKPPHVLDIKPSLFELRQQFEVALLTGDREATQQAINTINENELDSAANTRFMQIRLWDQFREYERLIGYQELSEVIQIRMPQLVRTAILRAFYDQFLAQSENDENFTMAFQTYSANVHPVVAGLIRSSSVAEGKEILHLVAYKAKYDGDNQLAQQLQEYSDDVVVSQLLSMLWIDESQATLPLMDQFSVAERKGDWSVVQKIGRELLENGEVPEGLFSRNDILSTLLRSLNFHANADLKERIGNLAPIDPKESPQIIAAPVGFAPQTWIEFVDYLKNSKWNEAEIFFSLDDRPLVSSLSITQVLQIVEDLQELLTDPEINRTQAAYELSIGATGVILHDLLSDPLFPKSSLIGAYRKLLEIWSQLKRGSASIPDANLLLTLAEVVLEFDSSSESLVVNALQEWWGARQIKALLPFLLDAVNLISEYTSDKTASENLWISGASLINDDPLSISQTERLLWQVIGKRIGFDDSTISEFLLINVEEVNQIIDPLAGIDLKKVAIVSLRAATAETAAALIRQRTDAQVVVVSDTVAGAGTDSAKTADVVLFVWSSSTHAVYRAFDSVRGKLTYVQGTGATSIIIALEHWAIKEYKPLEFD